MIKRRTLLTIAGLAAVVVVVVFVAKIGRNPGTEEGAAVPDMAVRVGRITQATVRRLVTAYGIVEPEPAGAKRAPADSEIASPVAGVVSSVDCVEGQRVEKGAVLFHLDSRVAEVALEKATKNLAYAQENFERQRKLLPVEGTSKKDYLEAEQQFNDARSQLAAAETDIGLIKITAPLSGTVVKINSEPGEAVELNTILAKIVDLGRLVGLVSVPSLEAASLRAGQPVRFEGFGEAEGAVVYVGQEIDGRTDTVPVRVSLPSKTVFRPGQFLTVRIVSEEHRDVLVVPEASVIADSIGADTGWIVVVAGDKADRRPVGIGIREAGLVEVRGEGLKEGLIIITEDAYAVPGETKIHVVR